SVRYSRVLISPFFGRRGVTFRILAVGGTTRRVGFVMICREICKVMAQAFFGQRGFGFATTSSGACRLEAAGGLGWFEFSSPTAVAMSGRGRKRGPGGEAGPSQNKDLGEELKLPDSPTAGRNVSRKASLLEGVPLP